MQAPQPLESSYLELAEELNEGRFRASISSGQAGAMHRLAILSKDRVWVLREEGEATSQVLDVLARRGACDRSGVLLDPRWPAGGWSPWST